MYHYHFLQLVHFILKSVKEKVILVYVCFAYNNKNALEQTIHIGHKSIHNNCMECLGCATIK